MVPFSFHSCSSDIHVLDTPNMQRVLRLPIPTDDTISTEFDLLLHPVFVEFAGFRDGDTALDAFNML